MKSIDVTRETSLKDLVTLANRENEVVLTEDNKPVAKVLPIAPVPSVLPMTAGCRKLGLHRGAWIVEDSFDEPLPDEFWLGEK